MYRFQHHTKLCAKCSTLPFSSCMYLYIGFKTFFYVVRHLDSIPSYLPTGVHLGFFRSWPSLFLPSSFPSVFLVLSFVSSFNLLKPTGYVMHQQFNIQQLYALPTLYLCVLYLSENKQRLVPLTA